MKYQEEKYGQVRSEIEVLFKEHWQEIALNQDKIKLNPDFDTYKTLNDAGILRIFTARQDGLLVGYFLVMVTPHIHYKDHSFAMNDIIYVHPKWRGATVAYRMIKHVENALKEDGVSVLIINMKTHSPFDRLLEGLKFTNTERLYSKYIGE